jgi:tetratricopeptide (TPR) repeat protein
MDSLRRILVTEPADPSALPIVLDELRSRNQVEEVIQIAERALAAMPDNFFALDALAWARIQRGEHAQAKQALHAALASLRNLGVERPFGRLAKLSLQVMRAIARLRLLPKRLSRMPSPDAIETNSAEWATCWRTWALAYLAWCEREENLKNEPGRPTSGCS